MKQKLSIMLIGLAVFSLMLSSISCGVMSSFFATPTPTATATFTPSPTPSPTSTATSTTTPLPSGRIKEKQADGSTVFTDYDGQYQLTMPEGWVVVITQKDDIDEIIQSAPVDSDLRSLLEGLKNSKDETLRAFSFNFKYMSRGYTPNINIGYQENSFIAEMTVDDMVKSFEQILPSMIKGLKVVDSGTSKTSSGIEIGFIKIAWGADLANGQRVDVRQKQIYIKTRKGVVIITLSESKSAATDLEPEFDQIVDGVQLLGK